MTNLEAQLKHVSVLIADPDLQVNNLVKEVLGKVGFTNVRTVTSGESALNILRQNEVDLLITDWRMSPVNGLQLIDFLRTDPNSPNPYLPIIMLTGKAELKDVSTARDKGVTEFMVKPFNAKSLYERLVVVIENPRSFILSNRYSGPDRRRRTDIPPAGEDRRSLNPNSN